MDDLQDKQWAAGWTGSLPVCAVGMATYSSISTEARRSHTRGEPEQQRERSET